LKRLLLTEADSAARQHISGALKCANLYVSTAEDGDDALRQLRARKFDLLLTSIQIPGPDGFELLARLRRRTRAPKVVVLISDEKPETLLQAMSARAFDFLAKSADSKDLARLVQSALTSKRGLSSIQLLSAQPNWLEMLVPCDLDVAERITRFIGYLQEDLPQTIREQAAHAFRELLHNAIEWGGRLDARRRVGVSYVRARRMLLYHIADPGSGFRFENLRHAAIANPPDQPTQHLDVRAQKGMRPGGFGLVLVKELVDELYYNQAQNEVVFIKYLDA
jgi:CheY-like chemotaxis protein/anti-sigma regulatory factor (Ser/Thr protein kinase)